MNSVELKRFLSGSETDIATLAWLKSSFMPMVLDRLNGDASRKRLALYGGDRIPENERNLTDFRNRISLIFEYEFARVITSILEEYEVDDLFCGYVVANRFPDLEMRRSDGHRGLRFEVKCLQSTAEEKAANFSTLRKDLMPATDFLTVFLWDWDNVTSTIQWDRAPFLFESYVFNASALATLRDWYWLNKPPSNLGSGYQGFDIRYAVNCIDGKFNEEEGNLGKLLRIWQPEKLDHCPPNDPLLDLTEKDYLGFKGEVVAKGFEVIAAELLCALSGGGDVQDAYFKGRVVGKKCNEFVFLSATLVESKDVEHVMRELDVRYAWRLLNKYDWRKYELTNGACQPTTKGNKPKYIVTDHHAD